MNKKLIVVCDDNAPLAVLIQQLLNKKGFTVMTANDGHEGLDLLKSSRPDVLLLDLEMPRMDGLDLLKGMQAFEGKRPYTLVLTAQRSTEKRAQASALGAQEVWSKPFNAAELLGRLDALIAQGAI